MGKLTDVDPTRLRDALRDVTDAKAAKRLVVALAYLDGVPPVVLADRYGIPRSTVYAWLDRFEAAATVDDAISDDDRPGRPPKLPEADRDRLSSDLESSPAEFGFDADEWTAPLVKRHVTAKYGVEYSVGHARRLHRTLTDE